VYKGRQIFFYKRAQIFVADLWAAYGKLTHAHSDFSVTGAESGSRYSFHDMDQLTCFADYRIPQLLRAAGVFQYTAALGQTVDLKGELAPGCEEEVEIRAATVVAVERLRDALTAKRTGSGSTAPRISAVEVDWYLWQQGEAKKDSLFPHHRTLTVFY
jgi:hypothetical protein